MEKISEELLYLLIDNMPAPAWYADVDGTFRFVNKAFSHFCGFSSADIGNFKWVALKIVHSDDLPLVVASWKNAITSLEPYSVEFRMWHDPSGEYRWIRSSAFYVKKEGKPIAWFGSNEDIHKYKSRLNKAVDLLQINESVINKIKSEASE